jgi:hypothetical protein
MRRRRRRRSNPSTTTLLIGAAVVAVGVAFILWQRKAAAATALPNGTPTAAGKVAYGGQLLTPAAVFSAHGQVIPPGTPAQQVTHAVQLIAEAKANTVRGF